MEGPGQGDLLTLTPLRVSKIPVVAVLKLEGVRSAFLCRETSEETVAINMQVRKDLVWMRMGAGESVRSRQVRVQIVFRTQQDLPMGQMWSGKENVRSDSCSVWPREREA